MLGLLRAAVEKFQRTTNPCKFWRSHGATIGEECEVYSSASFGSEPYLISIGNHVRINEGVRLITHDGGLWVVRKMYPQELSQADLFGRIKIGNNVHVGTNAIIMPGVSIGNNCIIGCSAVVTKNIPDGSIAVGVPARVIETVDDFIEKHRAEFVDTKGLPSKEKKESYY